MGYLKSRELSHIPYHTLYYDSQGAQTTTTASSQTTTASTNSNQNTESQHSPMTYNQHQLLLYRLSANKAPHALTIQIMHSISDLR
jgi:uncharacterized protein YcfL